MDYLKSLFKVENKVVVITGGSGILGTEMARGLLRAGAKVVLLARNTENLKKKVAFLKKNGSVVIGLQCDVTVEEDLRSVNHEILKKFGHIDVLINAAGGNVAGATIGLDQSVFDIEISQFNKVTDINLNGTVLSSLSLENRLRNKERGRSLTSPRWRRTVQSRALSAIQRPRRRSIISPAGWRLKWR